MLIKNKCLLCYHYTNENFTDECKIWACGDITGTPYDLVGCSQFSYKEEVVEYLVRIDGISQTYVFNSELQLNAFLSMKNLEDHVSQEKMHVEKIVKIVSDNRR